LESATWGAPREVSGYFARSTGNETGRKLNRETYRDEEYPDERSCRPEPRDLNPPAAFIILVRR
jgi:hypothetical protein